MTMYLLLNIAVMASLLVVPILLPAAIHWRAALIVLAILLITTVIFDSLIIAAGIVGYNLEAILGIYIGKAPIEDFAYAVIAALFVPYMWERLGKK
jgi:lycopene cyclase domain-containing protein